MRGSETNEILGALRSGPRRGYPEIGLRPHTEEELHAHWLAWAREELEAKHERPSWAHYRFVERLDAEEARAAWLEAEKAADERTRDQHRLESIIEYDIRPGDPFLRGLDPEYVPDLFARAEALR